MSKAEEYQNSYKECFKTYDANPEDIINSLNNLIGDMIETIRELEESTSKEYQAKQIRLQASTRTGII